MAQNQKALPAIQNLLAGPKTLEEQEAGPGPNSKLFHDAIKLFALVVGAQWLLEQISLFICHILAGVCSFKLCQTRKKSSTRALNPFLGKLGVQASNAMPILNLCPLIFNSIVNVFFLILPFLDSMLMLKPVVNKLQKQMHQGSICWKLQALRNLCGVDNQSPFKRSQSSSKTGVVFINASCHADMALEAPQRSLLNAPSCIDSCVRKRPIVCCLK